MSSTIGYDELWADTVRQVAKLMAAEAVDAILFVGLLPGWYPPSYDCGACGYATCAEFLHHTKTLRAQSAELEFTGPVCNLRDIDLGIAVGSAAKTAAIHSIDCRCQTRVAVAARKLALIQADHAVALSLSMSHKAVGFDRPMPEADFDNLDLPPTGTQPTGIPGTAAKGAPAPTIEEHAMNTALASAPTFSHAHILLTAVVTSVLASAAAFWRLPRGAWTDLSAVALLSGASVFLWRVSANMPQLNADGLPGFSANDWLAPVLTYVFLGAYAHLRPPADPRRYGQARALATIASLVVNVVTI